MRSVSRLGAELRLGAAAGGDETLALAAGSIPSWSVVDAVAWSEPSFDLVSLDEQVTRRAAAAGSSDSPVRILIRAARRPPGSRLTGRRLLGVARQVVTRYQRFFQWRNAASALPAFDRALALHERLHDRRKPLVAADFDHALDTWRWVLRLNPDASLAVQVAALFHDVERLDTEADARVEHLAPDYAAFKTAHAAAGARRVADLLARIDVSRDDARRICDLVERHELGAGARSDRVVARAPADAESLRDECRLLAEADALSFFSLNSSGFLRYYGPEHTARKVAYSLGRLGPAGRRELRRLKVPGAIHAMLGTLELNRLNETRDMNDMNETDAPRRVSPLDPLNATRSAAVAIAPRSSPEERPS